MSRLVERSKRAIAAAVVRSPAVRAVERAADGVATVILCHRFDIDDPLQASDSTAVLRETLEWLRRRRYHLLSVEEVVRAHLDRSPLPPRSVAFSIDDGYAEQAEVAAEVFAAYDCPVTIFLTTGFLDGDVLPWWDAIAHVIAHTDEPVLGFDGPDGPRTFDVREPARALFALHRIQEGCKVLPLAERDRLISGLASDAGVELPSGPVAPFEPMTWDRARSLEHNDLVRFGPHTLSHPILSSVDADTARREMTESWARVRAELTRPVPVFCYPNGEPGDFGEREIEVARSMDMIGAVSVEVGHADPRRHDPFRVRRVPFCPTSLDNLQWVSGFERAQQRIRRRGPEDR